MIRTIIGLAMAGMTLAPFANTTPVASPESEQADAPWVAEYGVDPIVTSVGAAQPAVRHLKVETSQGSCILSVTNMAAVQAEPSCSDVQAGLEKAAVWQANGEFAAIADASGRVVLEVGASDGFAYEGTSETGGVVTLTEADI